VTNGSDSGFVETSQQQHTIYTQRHKEQLQPHAVGLFHELSRYQVKSYRPLILTTVTAQCLHSETRTAAGTGVAAAHIDS